MENVEVYPESAENPAQQSHLFLTKPEVYLCLNCNTIIGDSLLILEKNTALSYLFLSHPKGIDTNIPIEQVQISNDQIDRGCTYCIYKCPHCLTVLGRYYISTTREMDMFRGAIKLDFATIKVYKLGNSSSDDASSDAISPINEERVSNIEIDIVKIKDFCLMMSQRMDNLETAVDLMARQFIPK